MPDCLYLTKYAFSVLLLCVRGEQRFCHSHTYPANLHTLCLCLEVIAVSVPLVLATKYVISELLLCGRGQQRCCHSHTYPVNVISLYTLLSVPRGYVCCS